MTAAIPIGDWLEVLDREYLSTFIRDGGASVKFAVVGDERKPDLRAALKRRCEGNDYLFVEVDAAVCGVHMPHEIFFAVASQVDWRLLARRAILRLLRDIPYPTGGIDPEDTENIVDSVARANGLESATVISELRPPLQDSVRRNPEMARTFRTAMTWLCRKEMESAVPGQYAGQPLLDWLTGANRRIGPVREFEVYSPIDRTTARYFFESALYWVRFAGYSGTVVLLDNSRVAVARNPRDGKRYYTRAMTVDHYEVLREFIDGVDRLSGALLTVVSDETFVDEHAPRGWGLYAALRTRVMNDVRDRRVANPAAALVGLS